MLYNMVSLFLHAYRAIIGLLGCLMLLGAFLDTTLRSVDYKPPPSTVQLVINRTSDTYPYQRVRSPPGDDGRGPREEGIQREQALEEEVPTGEF